MKKRKWRACAFASALFFLTLPLAAGAHEVYVLSPQVIAHDISIESPDPFSMVPLHQYEFFLWGFISIAAVVVVLLVSITKAVETAIDPFLMRMKKYAPLAARLTLGICFLACGYFQALFGPELPLSQFAGQYAEFLSILFYVLGALLIANLFVREAALIALVVFVIAVFHYGLYMLTYANYLGEILVALMLGNAFFAPFQKYTFLILRVLFGAAVAFASFYAKFWHSQLALDTVIQYHLTNYFHFAPLFVVLGAFIIELLIGIFFIIGFEVRFTALFFLFFLFLSLFYFGEVIWPHLVLIGVNIVMLLHGYDRYTVGAWMGKKTHLEPVF